MARAEDMTTFIGLLRAVNLAAHNRIGMSDLRALLTALGLQDPQTLLQSGNVVFRADARTPAQLEQLIEDAAARRLGLRTDVFVRTHTEWKAMIAANPFGAEAKRDPSHLLVLALKQPVDRKTIAALQQAIVGREVVQARGRHAYAVYPDGIGRSRLTSALIERALGTRATGRTWNTVLKLDALAGVGS
jgi:uncharacterized protein (DUF1697 family)